MDGSDVAGFEGRAMGEKGGGRTGGDGEVVRVTRKNSISAANLHTTREGEIS